jgi:hypothetical protein
MPIVKVPYLGPRRTRPNRYFEESRKFLTRERSADGKTNFEFLNGDKRPRLQWGIRSGNDWPDDSHCRSHRYNHGPVTSQNHGPFSYVELAQDGVVFTHHALLNGHLATAPYLIRGFAGALRELYFRNGDRRFIGLRFLMVYEGRSGLGAHGDFFCERIKDGITDAGAINETL